MPDVRVDLGDLHGPFGAVLGEEARLPRVLRPPRTGRSWSRSRRTWHRASRSTDQSRSHGPTRVAVARAGQHRTRSRRVLCCPGAGRVWAATPAGHGPGVLVVGDTEIEPVTSSPVREARYPAAPIARASKTRGGGSGSRTNGFEPPPSPWQGDALPTELRPQVSGADDVLYRPSGTAQMLMACGVRGHAGWGAACRVRRSGGVGRVANRGAQTPKPGGLASLARSLAGQGRGMERVGGDGSGRTAVEAVRKEQEGSGGVGRGWREAWGRVALGTPRCGAM